MNRPDRFVVSTWNSAENKTEYKVASEKVSCPSCAACRRVPGELMCIYGMSKNIRIEP